MLALFFAGFSGGCTTLPGVDALRPVAELEATPFHPQSRYQCGPAALLTVLEQSGAAAELDALVDQVYLPEAEGSLQVELVAATRRAGRIPWVLPPTAAALHAELAAGRPVLVMQNLGVSWWPRWHYAVVIGIEPDAVVLRSGTERRRETRPSTFLRTWRRSGNWAMVALAADELPAEPDRQRWFDALVTLEETGHAELARDAWSRAIREWPDSLVPRFGLANSHFALSHWQAAERELRALLRQAPGTAAARNNLALTLLRQGRIDAAEAEAQRALADAAGSADVQNAVSDTLGRIRDAREGRH